MPALRLVLGDQLTPTVSSLKDYQDGDLVLMAEVMEEASYVPHHKKKIAFLFSAMRHFADTLKQSGITVRYIALDDADNSTTLAGEIDRVLTKDRFDEVIVTEPGEYRLKAEMEGWSARFGLPVHIRRDDRFIASLDRFNAWANGRKRLTLEYFYRDMRRDTGLLMDGDKPLGGQWNYDADNRKSLPADLPLPAHEGVAPDQITQDVLELVQHRFEQNFGDLEPFSYAVTAADAEAEFERFITERLSKFGDYQDAMKQGEAFLFHSVIALYLNCGLLDPLKVCQRAEAAYHDGQAPLNAVEGFIRQILGWREYVRGIYWRFMPDYLEHNTLNAQRPLPEFYWTADTQMACVRDAVLTTRQHAYAHHIQRLMVTGNFALLAGIEPGAVNAWYLAVYADAYEWVEAPNTHGMALFADGGIMATKPYAASGSYINKMSDHCKGCSYTVSKKNGPKACPFNYLYWNFLMENRERLQGNHRLGMIYKTLDRMDADKHTAIRDDSVRFFKQIGIETPLMEAERR